MFIRLAALALCLFVSIPSAAHAECTKNNAENKFDMGLQWRWKLSGYSDDFNAKVRPFRRNVQEILDSFWDYEDDPAKTAELTEQLCVEVDKTIAAADDVLAGGDGSGGKSPWETYTPEKMMEIDAEYARLCKEVGEKICDDYEEPLWTMNRELEEIHYQFQADQISMPELVDRMSETVLKGTAYLKSQRHNRKPKEI